MAKLQTKTLVAECFPTPFKPLPNQRSFFDDADDRRGQQALFDDGRDLPGADERDQQIIWDVARD